MNKNVADQIAELLNENNSLTTPYTRVGIRNYDDDYIVLQDEDIVIGCVCVKRIQWYQFEIKHLVVNKDYRSMGYGKSLIDSAITFAKERGGLIVQCTIKKENVNTRTLFSKWGFDETINFINPNSGNNLVIYQKNITDNK